MHVREHELEATTENTRVALVCHRHQYRCPLTVILRSFYREIWISWNWIHGFSWPVSGGLTDCSSILSPDGSEAIDGQRHRQKPTPMELYLYYFTEYTAVSIKMVPLTKRNCNLANFKLVDSCVKPFLPCLLNISHHDNSPLVTPNSSEVQ